MNRLASFPYPLLFLRHGQTAWNEQGRYQGTSDPLLSDEGGKQASLNAELVAMLQRNGPLKRGELPIATSPLARAIGTAEIIMNGLGYRQNATIVPAFRELSMGRWEGLTSPQVKDRYYEERKLRKKDRWNFAPAEGESMAQRAPEIERAIQELKPHSVVITHSVVLRIIWHLLGDISRERASILEIPHLGGVLWNAGSLKTVV